MRQKSEKNMENIVVLLVYKSLRSFKQHKFVVFHGSSGGQKSKTGPQERVPSGGSMGFHALPFPASRGRPPSLVHGPLPPSSKQAYSLFSPP